MHPLASCPGLVVTLLDHWPIWCSLSQPKALCSVISTLSWRQLRDHSPCLVVKRQRNKYASIQFQSHENLPALTSLFLPTLSYFFLLCQEGSVVLTVQDLSFPLWFTPCIFLRTLTFCSNITSHLNIQEYFLKVSPICVPATFHPRGKHTKLVLYLGKFRCM